MSLNFRSLDLNLLRVFDEVMSERSLTRAAHKLSITQPAVSNAMRRLREVLGDELLVRQGQGVEPTPRAQALWPVIREALQHLEGALAPDEFDPETAATTFVIAMADATAATLIPPLYPILAREAPGLGIRLLPLTTRDPRPLLDDGEAEVFARAALSLKYDDPDKPAPVTESQILMPRRFDDRRPDLWSVFNRTQENLTKGGLHGRSANGRRQQTRPVQGIDSDIRLNRALWLLADGLRQLKA